jgi:hypothetical protein
MPFCTDAVCPRLRPLERLIRAELYDMHGMELTSSQFRRLWGLGDEDGRALLERLVADGFLAKRGDACYLRS